MYPYEVFTYQGVTEEAAAALLGTAISDGNTSTRVINGYVTGDTGWNIGNADSIMVAGGFEHRTEKYERISDTIFQTGGLLVRVDRQRVLEVLTTFWNSLAKPTFHCCQT